MAASPGSGSANPRKFSEKIALHTQRQAEETRAFEQLMTDLTLSRVRPGAAAGGAGGRRGRGRSGRDGGGGAGRGPRWGAGPGRLRPRLWPAWRHQVRLAISVEVRGSPGPSVGAGSWERRSRGKAGSGGLSGRMTPRGNRTQRRGGTETRPVRFGRCGSSVLWTPTAHEPWTVGLEGARGSRVLPGRAGKLGARTSEWTAGPSGRGPGYRDVIP